jgi:16S rRNA (cytosine1402-N4)-methyltransferase
VEPAHQPVLLAEALEHLAVKPGGLYVDGTVGLGGHAAEILRRCAPDGRLLGTDRDAEALALARARLAEFGERVWLRQADFRELPDLLASRRPDGILLDLGTSSLQLDDPERGFSFRRDGPLDMRMDRGAGENAADLLRRLPERALADLIHAFGEERAARRVAHAIVRARALRPLERTGELAALVRGAVRGRGRLDPATRTFQALRIAVNRELEGLDTACQALAGILAPQGRLVAISFHGLEDRQVKHAFRSVAGQGFRLLTRKPVRPGPEEARANPRSRSARLRALVREAA